MTLEHFDTILAFVLIITGVSLLVTALNQAVSALLGLRGSHLRWGLKTLLTNLDPNLQVHAKEIAEQVLHHPLISDSAFSRFKMRWMSRWKLANAVRKEELVEILRLLAKPPSGQPANAAGPAWAVALDHALAKPDPLVEDEMARVVTEVQKLFPNDAAKAKRLLAPLVDSAAQLPARVDQWFDSVMDRSSQRFALHMRIWTVVFSVVMAFALQLDAFSLFSRLSTDAQLRAQVIASAGTLTGKAEELLVASTNAPPVVYGLAMKQLVAEHTNDFKGVEVPLGFKTLAEAQAWLAAELKKAKLSDPENQWGQRYEAMIPQAKLRAATENLNSLLTNKLIFQFVPQPYPDPIYQNW